MIGYANGPRGLEPKLKLEIKAIASMPETENLSLSKFVDRIILGPLSSPLAMTACGTMVESLGHSSTHRSDQAVDNPVSCVSRHGATPYLQKLGILLRRQCPISAGQLVLQPAFTKKLVTGYLDGQSSAINSEKKQGFG